MPLAATIQSGNLVHSPTCKALFYLGSNWLQVPGAPSSGAQNLDATISCPSIGPNRTLYVTTITTRGSAGASYSAPLFNNRAMTQRATTGDTFTKPIQWWSIDLLNNETSGVLRWREAGSDLRSMWYSAWQSRGMRSRTVYHAQNTSAGGSSGAFQSQNMSLVMQFPPLDRGFLLLTGCKGINDSGDSTNFNGTNLATLFTNQRFTMGLSNSFHAIHAYTQLDNTGSSVYSGTYTCNFFTNSLPVSTCAAIVLY